VRRVKSSSFCASSGLCFESGQLAATALAAQPRDVDRTSTRVGSGSSASRPDAVAAGSTTRPRSRRGTRLTSPR